MAAIIYQADAKAEPKRIELQIEPTSIDAETLTFNYVEGSRLQNAVVAASGDLAKRVGLTHIVFSFEIDDVTFEGCRITGRGSEWVVHYLRSSKAD